MSAKFQDWIILAVGLLLTVAKANTLEMCWELFLPGLMD